ncbi:MAG: amidohydrolase family protein [Prevotella sp.]|nr:amidohydrolase family protein [Prevotella sp.]
MTDNHVHIGWYTNGYHTPEEVWQAARAAGIDEIVVSSTSTCAELYKLVVREFQELIRMGGPRVHPILWLTPRMMKTWGIRYMLHSKIRWQGVKMHWEAHHEWYYNRKLTAKALDVARKLNVPVLLHTGNFKKCHANVFKPFCLENPDMTFVLAHGRPLDEAIDVLKNCQNAMVDTAFMPPHDVMLLAENGFTDRILFGTDAPINLLFYEDRTTTEYIKFCRTVLQNTLPQSVYERIMSNQLYK